MVTGRSCGIKNIQNSNDTALEDYEGVFEDVHLIECNFGYWVPSFNMNAYNGTAYNMTCIWKSEKNKMKWYPIEHCKREYEHLTVHIL